MGHQASVVYAQKIKDKSIVFNRNIKEFNPEQREYVASKMKEFMETFGYCSQVDGLEEKEWVQE